MWPFNKEEKKDRPKYYYELLPNYVFADSNKSSFATIIKKEVNDIEEDENVEWVWVEGYKGFDKNLKCQDFQYEVGKKYVHDSKVKLCKSGFHFCLKLEDVFGYYSIEPEKKNKYCKVKGFVKKEDRNSYGYNSYDATGIHYNNKLVAKEIEILQELSVEDIFPFMVDYYPWVENIEDYKYLFLEEKDYKVFAKNKISSLIESFGFNNSYSLILASRIFKIETIEKQKETLEMIKALCSEDLSKDMLVYLIEDKFK